MPTDDGPIPHPWSHPSNGVRGTDTYGRYVLVEPRAKFLAHDSLTLCSIGFRA